MSHPAPSLRSRLAAISGGLIVALSLVSVPAALAQEDGPEVTVQNLLAAIEAKDFEALPTFFCEEFSAQADIFDLPTLAGTLPEGTDVEALMDVFILDVEVASLQVISQTESEAVVALAGTILMDIDMTALAPFIEGLLAAMGHEVTPDRVEAATGEIASEFATETTDIDEEITLVPGEAMPWLICDELGGSADASPAAGGDSALADPSPPEGPSLTEWSADSSLTWRWLDSGEFDCEFGDHCWGMLVAASAGCPSNLYVELQLLDASDTVVGFTNDVVGGLLPGQRAKLLFETFDEGAVQARPTEMSCY